MQKELQSNLIKNASYRSMQDSELNFDYSREVIHIHDKEYFNVSYNCLGISLKNIINDIEDFDYALTKIEIFITELCNEQSGGIGIINIDEDLKKFAQKNEKEILVKNFRNFFEKLNANLRKGIENAYVTFNLGQDISEEGRIITKCILEALRLGSRDKGRQFIFPNVVFKYKKGVNEDLFSLATEVTAVRMNPTYLNLDSELLRDYNPLEIGIMGCRTLVTKNINGKSGSLNRGNVQAISLNLPKIATISKNFDNFIENLEIYMNETMEILKKKHDVLSEMDKNNFGILTKYNLYVDSDKELRKMFSNGTYSIGFIGIWETLAYLFKKEISKEFVKDNIEKALEIIKFMRNKTDYFSNVYGLNVSLLASAGEGICKKFAIDDPNYEYYTNSFHVPVYLEINIKNKIEIESKFVKYCNGGNITYVEFPHPMKENPKTISCAVLGAFEYDITYFGINFKLDVCNECNSEGVFDQECPFCSSTNIDRYRRVSGYISLKQNLSIGKAAEEKIRKSNLILETGD
ncbi:anaerobic ribonucleoside-triphosphate reductase [Streptobacillus canis]|uniref:anaerobic ribonucleoside-triphosphate reductase n=1 Tax=Streptobacillus canis TaxID=2678686 RepID=UPI0012E2EA2D|nr:anaerobic ribonucleoside-triphosphate reductase [Streptobacillus canis]